LTAGPATTNFSYFAFSLAVSNSYQAALSRFSFDDRASGTGPTKFDVQISTNTVFSSVIYDSGEKSAHTAFSTTPMNSFALSVSNLTGTLYFRIYAYAAGGAGGTWRIDNVNVQGNTNPTGGAQGGTGWYVDSISVQDAICCVTSVTPPVAGFTATPTVGTAPLTVNFTDTSTGTVTNWFWDFGDGTQLDVTTNAVSHDYTAGVYGVTLIVTGPGGTSTNVQPNYITAYTPWQAWQEQYFSCTNCAQALPDADPLGKGMSNTNQFLAGLNPTNPASLFRITSVVRDSSNNVHIVWSTAGSHTNAVQATAGGVDGSYNTNYVDITAPPHLIISGSGDTTTNYIDVGGGTNVPARYYRVRLVP
jgi:PKD repeat protein